MNADMILTCGEHVSVRLVEELVTIEQGTNQAIYRLPGGRYVVGFTEDGQIYQDPDASPGDFEWSEPDEESD
jgi:hypothetical protein